VFTTVAAKAMSCHTSISQRRWYRLMADVTTRAWTASATMVATKTAGQVARSGAPVPCSAWKIATATAVLNQNWARLSTSFRPNWRRVATNARPEPPTAAATSVTGSTA
jgi:hypothetical protein